MKQAFTNTLSAVLFIGATIFCNAPCYAGAWLQEKGQGYDAIQAGYFTGDDFFDINAERQNQSRFSKLEINYYVEYGVLSWLTVGNNLFFTRASQSGDHNIGLADSEFFARVKAIEYDGWVASIQPLIKLPSYYEDSDPPRAGSKSADGELSLLISGPYEVLSERDYLDARIGYRVRNHGLGDQIRSDVAYTIYVSDEVALIPAYRSIFSTQLPTTNEFQQDGDQDFNLHRAEIGLSWQFEEKSRLLVSIFSHISGSNAGAGEGFTVGLGRNF